MKNDLLTIGNITVHGYGLMISIGFLLAYFVTEYRAKKRKLDDNQILNLAICLLLSGYLCSKLLYYITIWKDILANPRILLDFANGYVVYGGLIGGILGAYIYCRCRKLPFLKYSDLIVPAVALAQGFGRIGCFLAGCCYGRETTGALHIVFHASEYAPNNVALIPTQLISSGLNFCHFFLLLYLAKKTKQDGQLTACFLIFYSIGRFVLEFFRGDLARGSVGILSTSQFISIFTLLVGIIFFYVRKGKDNEEN